MPRKKASETELLQHEVKTRVNSKRYGELTQLLARSRHRTMSELVRHILENKPVTVLHHDDSLDQYLPVLIGIRSELKAIGSNINQVTHYFHGTTEAQQKVFYALKLSSQYQQVEAKAEQLLSRIAQLAGQWLQK